MNSPGALIGVSGPSAVLDWIGFEEPGVMRVCTGKVELGQGIVTALGQIAASVLDVDIGRVKVVSGHTGRTPNEGYTGSSLSIEVSGLCVLRAAMTARQLLLQRAAAILGVALDALSVDDGTVSSSQSNLTCDFWQLAQEVDLAAPVEDGFDWKTGGTHGKLIGRSLPRIDLADKVAGHGFIHDIELPEMLHARALKPPRFGAKLAQFDRGRLSASFPDVRLWIDGSFVAVLAEREYDAVQALEFAWGLADWQGGAALPEIDDWPAYLKRQEANTTSSERGAAAASGDGRRLRATYSKPPIAHASMAPSCALAHWDDAKLTVWSSSQGVFNLRYAIAMGLGVSADDIVVIHVPSAGCYGHNGADDAAMEAALLARAFAPRPVRVQWTRQDELAWSPFGSPMAVEIGAQLDAQGRIADWTTEIWSGTQVRRPGFLPGLVDFVSTSQLAEPIPFSDPATNPYAFVGADRNAEPLYEIPHIRIDQHHLPGLPLRLSTLRALGGYANVFALESFMDELSGAASCDPVEFRLRHLTDPRARAVIERAAALAGWSDAPQAGCAKGLGFARYKNSAAYAAIVAEVEVGDEIRLLSLTGAIDAGLAINPDGLLNQIEGGAIQAASWTLLEEVTFDSRMVTSTGWDSYPIMRFAQAPRLRFEIVGGQSNPPLGVGEAAQGPTAAAIANAVARALDMRIRDLPINRARILAAVSSGPPGQ